VTSVDTAESTTAPTARAVLIHIVSSIVSSPQEVVVKEEASGTVTRLLVHVADGDAGRVIGKRGRVINSVRTVVAAAGTKDGRTVEVDVVDS
jgi:hypothetical protein